MSLYYVNIIKFFCIVFMGFILCHFILFNNAPKKRAIALGVKDYRDKGISFVCAMILIWGKSFNINTICIIYLFIIVPLCLIIRYYHQQRVGDTFAFKIKSKGFMVMLLGCIVLLSGYMYIKSTVPSIMVDNQIKYALKGESTDVFYSRLDFFDLPQTVEYQNYSVIKNEYNRVIIAYPYQSHYYIFIYRMTDTISTWRVEFVYKSDSLKGDLGVFDY